MSLRSKNDENVKEYEVFKINKKCFKNASGMILRFFKVFLVAGRSRVGRGSVVGRSSIGRQAVVGRSTAGSQSVVGWLLVDRRSIVGRSSVGRRSSCSTSLPGGDQVDGLPPAASRRK